MKSIAAGFRLFLLGPWVNAFRDLTIVCRLMGLSAATIELEDGLDQNILTGLGYAYTFALALRLYWNEPKLN